MAKAKMQVENSTPSNSYLSWEVFAMGGLSIVASLAFWLIVGRHDSLYTVSQVAFSIAFVANHPHFLSSYILLYGDFRTRIFQYRRYFWAGVIVPVILIGLLAYALLASSQPLMAHIITAMFFFVGWHYVKQIFGCVIVTSAQRKMYYSMGERRLMLVNLFAVWSMSWLTGQVYDPRYDMNSGFMFYGVNHYRMNLPIWTLQTAYVVMAITLLAVIWMHISRYKKSGVKPSAPGVAAYLSLYVWYIPMAIHPAFAYFIPFFHSIQYMAFVWTLKRNQVASEISSLDLATVRERRREWLNRFGGFMANAAVLGALTFEFIPKSLDAKNLLGTTSLGATPFLAAILLFVNIHHYFIDNVIWRSDNPTVKQFLFQASSSKFKKQKSSAA